MNRHFLPICCLLSLAVQSFLHGDWPRWRGVQGDGTWNGPEICRGLLTAGLKGVWKTKVFPGYSGITIQDGLLYLMDRPNSEEGKGMERILAWMRVQERRCGFFPIRLIMVIGVRERTTIFSYRWRRASFYFRSQGTSSCLQFVNKRKYRDAWSSSSHPVWTKPQASIVWSE